MEVRAAVEVSLLSHRGTLSDAILLGGFGDRGGRGGGRGSLTLI